MQTEKTGVIYRIYHKGSMKSYIGKSVNPERRIHKHLNGKSSSPVLRNAIKKYGADAFCVEILEKDVPESVLSKLEILHIRFFNCKNPNGYNFTDGGEGISGLRHSPETRQKISQVTKGRTAWNKGKTGLYEASLETRRKLSEALKGKTAWNKGKAHSPEARRKMSEAAKGKTPWNKGKVHSPETRQKLSEAAKGNTWNEGKSPSPETRRKLSEANKGKSHSPETRRKISESLKRRNCSA